MMKTSKRLLAFVLVLVMAFGNFTTVVSAAEAEEAVVEQPAPQQDAVQTEAPAGEAEAAPAGEAQSAQSAEESQPAAADQAQPEAAPIPEAEEQPAENENSDEYSSAPSTVTVTFKFTVDGVALPEAQDVKVELAPGALLTEPKEAEQYEWLGYELKYYKDEYKLQPIDFEKDYITVSADMTVWVDVVKPAPVPVAPAEPEAAPEVEEAPTETEVPAPAFPGMEGPGIEEPGIVEPMAPAQVLLVIDHVLNCEAGSFTQQQQVSVDASALDSGLDLAAYAIVREGLEVDGALPVLTAADVIHSNTGSFVQAVIAYKIADGYKATAARTPDGAQNSVYQGAFDDVTITPADMVRVEIDFVYEENGATALPSAIYYMEKGTALNHAIDESLLTAGFILTSDNENFPIADGKITGTVTESVTITVTVSLNKVNYTVKFVNAETDEPMPGKDELTLQGVVGESTALEGSDTVSLYIEGYDYEYADITLQADATKNVIEVKYTAVELRVSYDSQGGSYIEPKVGKYGDKDIEIYKEIEGHDENVCGLQEHTHTDCYKLTCTKEEHTHSSVFTQLLPPTLGACYSWIHIFGFTIPLPYLSCDKEVHTHSIDQGCYTNTCGLPEHVHGPECKVHIDHGYDPAPTRPGYVFAGWYQDEDCTRPAPQNLDELKQDVTVYAKWEGSGQAAYTIVYRTGVWNNSTGKEDLVYYTSYAARAQIGSTVTADFTHADTPAYHQRGATTSAEVAPDGSTVVYADFNLIEYMLSFSASTNIDKSGSLSYSFTAHIGEDIAGKWPTAADNARNNKFYGWKPSHAESVYVSKRPLLTADMIGSGTTASYEASYQSGLENVQLNYWLETEEGGVWSSDNEYTQRSVSAGGDYSAKDIYGFTKRNTKPSGSQYPNSGKTGSTYNFYYDRNEYTIEYHNGTELFDTIENVPFDKDISGDDYSGKKPEKAPEGKEGYEFAGWYDNVQCLGDAYTFSKMPAGNLALYAKWVAPKYTVTFHTGYPGVDTKTETQEVTHGQKPTPPSLSNSEDWFFAGWAYDKDGTDKFDPAKPIEEATDLYAIWKPVHTWKYTVQHVYEDTGVTVTVNGVTSSKTTEVTVRARTQNPDGVSGTYLPDAYTKIVDKSTRTVTFTYTKVELESLTYDVVFQYKGETLDALTKADQKVPDDVTAGSTLEVVYNATEDDAKTLLEGYGLELNQTFVRKALTSGENVLVFTCTPANFEIRYENVDGAIWPAGESENSNPSSYTIESGDIALVNPESKGDQDFIGWAMSTSTTNRAGDHDPMSVVIEPGMEKTKGHLTFTAQYAPKATITYKAEPEAGGTVSNPSETLRPVLGEAEGSTATANDGWKFVGWSKEGVDGIIATAEKFTPEKVEVSVGSWTVQYYESATYVAHFVRDEAQLKVEYKTDVDGVTVQDHKDYTAQVVIGETYTANIPDKVTGSDGKNYAFDHFAEGSASATGTMEEGGKTVTAVYSLDEKGTDPEDPDKPGDGIPDKYQKTVTYKVVNGKFTDGTTETSQEVLLGTKDENGEWSYTKAELNVPEDTVNMNADTGYKTGAWAEPVPGAKVSKDGPFEYTYTYEKDESQKKTLTYSVQYYQDGVAVGDPGVYTNSDLWINDPTTKLAVKDGSVNTTDMFGDKWTFVRTDPAPVPDEVEDDTIIHVYYAKDENDNDIPDVAEATVTYKVENGYLDDEGKPVSRTEEVAFGYRGENDAWVDGDTATLEKVPVDDKDMHPNAGYDNGEWRTEGNAAPATVTKDGVKEFTFAYEKNNDLKTEYTIKVEYYQEQADGTYPEAANKTGEIKKSEWAGTPEADVSFTIVKSDVDADPFPGYVLDVPVSDQLPKTGVKPNEDPIKLYYAKDEKGGENGEGDKIPDKYQVEVTYQVNFGYWNEGESDNATKSELVTLTDEAGNWSATGSGTLKKAPTAGNNPADGYTAGSWSASEPVNDETSVTENTIYTYTYEKGTYGYTVNYHYDDVTATESKSGTFGVPMVYDETSPKTYNDHNYILENVVKQPEDGTITSDAEQNVVDVYYTLDEKGTDPEDPEHPGDKIPDKYQVEVIYQSAGNGKVDPVGSTITNLFTDELGSEFATSGTVTAHSVATADAGYAFDYWTKGDEKIESPAALNETLTDVKGGTTITYTAHFDTDTLGGTDPDDPGDNIPDKYQVEVTYTVTNGRFGTEEAPVEQETVTDVVTLLDENGKWAEDGTGKLNPPAAGNLPNAGYRADKWDTADGNAPTEVTKNSEKKKFNYQYVEDPTDTTPYSFYVKYYKDDALDETKTETVTKDVWSGTPADVMLNVEAGDIDYAPYGSEYMLEKTDPEKIPDEVKPGDTIQLYFVKDVIGDDPDDPNGTGDNIPDKYQVEVIYESAGNGSVEPEGSVVTTFTNEDGSYATSGTVAAHSVATAKEGYAFDKWTAPIEGTQLTNPWNAELNESFESEGGKSYMYIASFDEDTKGGEDGTQPDDIPDKYQATVTYKSADETQGTVDPAGTYTVTFGDREKGFETSGTYTASSTASAKENYAFDYWDKDGVTIDSDATLDETLENVQGGTTITYTAYFDEDTKGGEEDGNQPDGTPDKYQAIIYYKADANGSVEEKFTRSEKLDEGKTATLTASATAKANPGYAFDYWDKDGEKIDAEAALNETLTDVKGGTTITYTAHFATDTNGDNIPDYKQDVVITVVGNKDIAVFDGSNHTVSGYEITSVTIGEKDNGKALPVGVTLSIAPADATITESAVGTYPMGLTGMTATEGGFHSVTVKVTDGWLQIVRNTIDPGDPENPNPTNPPEPGEEPETNPDPVYGGVTVGELADVVYNGTSQQQTPAVLDEDGSPLDPDYYNVTFSQDTTNVGQVTVTVTGKNGYEGTVTRTYNITPRTVTVNTDPATRAYNGAALTAGGRIEGLVNASDATLTTTGTQTNQGTSPNTYEVAFSSEEMAKNYDVEDGTIGDLTVTPRAVTLTSATATKVYDGTPLTDATVTVGGAGFVNGEGATYNVTGTLTDVGNVPNAFTYTLNPNTLARNYNITPVTGTLTITQAAATAMTVGTPTSVPYDGELHQWIPNVTGPTGAALAEGTDYTVTYSTADFTNVGEITVTITGMGNYAGTATRTYRITPRIVLMTSGTATRAYNGAALTNPNVTATGFVEGEGATYNVTGSQTNVGTATNTYGYTLNDNTSADNYRITQFYGNLTVTPAALNVSNPNSFAYDGQAHQWTPTVTGVNGAAQLGTDYTMTYSTTDFTDVGTITVTVTGTGNYAGTVTRTYRITPRMVIMTSASATKAYDGTALRAENVRATGFAAGEGAQYNVTGSQIAEGSSRNTFTYTLNNNTDADNYRITQFYGNLTVTAAEPVEIPEDETPLGGEPDNTPEPTDEPVVIDENDTPLGGLPVDPNGGDYTVNEEVVIDENETPLAGGPSEHICCILHFILMLCALTVAMYFTHDRKKRQEREFELRSELQDK